VTLSLVACESPEVAAPEGYGATVTIDARSLLAAGHGGPVSVIEQAELVVTDAVGGRRVIRAPLTVDEPVAALEVQVAAGPHRFEGRVVSNSGAVLLAGSRDVDVRSDGFVVEIDLRAVAGVLVVDPDSVLIPGGGQFTGRFRVENRGSEALAWQVVAVDPPLISCDVPCLVFRPEGGQIGAGGIGNLEVLPRSLARGLYRARIASTVGSVELKVFVDDSPVGSTLRSTPH
jgi:hypothetical protein